jgi:hypothetical protein
MRRPVMDEMAIKATVRAFGLLLKSMKQFDYVQDHIHHYADAFATTGNLHMAAEMLKLKNKNQEAIDLLNEISDILYVGDS